MSRTSEEAINILNKRLNSKPSNWKWRKDIKKFGWGQDCSKNHQCKAFGWSNGKEYRRERRKRIAAIRHKMFKHIPLTEEDIDFAKHSEILREVEWHLSLTKLN